MTFRPVYGGLRSPRWLRAFQYGPMVSAFRNLETGQVVFTQTLHPQQYYLDRQFKFPNWQNRKPTLRKDIWRPLAVAEVPSHEDAVSLYKNLVELRNMRDRSERKKAKDWRRKSKEGNIWYWNQFRPTYTHEAVADLSSALYAMRCKSTIYWDAEYRKGSESVWEDIEVSHDVLPRHNPREQFVVLNEIRKQSLKRAAPKPELTPDQREQLKDADRQRKHIRELRAKQREQLLEARPDLRELDNLKQAVAKAEESLAKAEANYDHFLPHGQRGAAKAPIKLRKSALRQAKRLFRQAKHRHAARNNKRRVAQPRIRLGHR